MNIIQVDSLLLCRRLGRCCTGLHVLHMYSVRGGRLR